MNMASDVVVVVDGVHKVFGGGGADDVKALSGYLFIDGKPVIAFAMIANDLKTPGTAWPVFEKVLGLVTEEIR